MTPYRDITDDEWQRVAALLPELRPRTELRGRPLANTRAVLNGVLWVIYSGATWSAIPRRYPSYQTCHRRFKVWHETGALKQVLVELFGSASDDLCEVMGARMRTHPHSKAAEARHAVDHERRPSPLQARLLEARGLS
ncbi:transposase [Burkholderia sp. FERM BP-3421]|jgi:transposase|uniref:transposase n=1 Tax=Burkholderia sp. FERM BP-3421 TaxID=1494466 RepID=UPI00235FD65C|nr:transposase [Burkholderia sp. FERM BP-3421]WDD94375.1 transposase [Burkholderia sp. FERM BP-3421]